MTEVIAGLQYLWLALLAILVGGAVWTLLLPPAERDRCPGLLSGAGAGLAAMLLPGAFMARALAHAMEILGDFVGPLGPALAAYVDATPQGQAALLMALPAVLLSPTVIMLRRRAPARVLALSVLVLAIPLVGGQAAQGHAQILGGGSLGLWPMPADVARGALVDAVHVAAALVWIGGLFHLAAAGLRGAPLPDAATRRFSNLALLCVAAIVASGLGTYELHFGSRIRALFSGWGVTLLLKLLLFAPMLVLALLNRQALRRADALPPRRVAAELMLGMLALLLGSLLSQLDPHSWES